MCFCWRRKKHKKSLVVISSSPRLEFDKIYDKVPQFDEIPL